VGLEGKIRETAARVSLGECTDGVGHHSRAVCLGGFRRKRTNCRREKRTRAHRRGKEDQAVSAWNVLKGSEGTLNEQWLAPLC